MFSSKIACRHIRMLQGLCSSTALVLCPSNIFLIIQSPKKQEKRVLTLPSQGRVSVPFLENRLSNLLLPTFDGDFTAYPNYLITLSSLILTFPLTSNLNFLAISLICCEYRKQNGSFSSMQEHFTTLNTYYVLAPLQLAFGLNKSSSFHLSSQTMLSWSPTVTAISWTLSNRSAILAQQYSNLDAELKLKFYQHWVDWTDSINFQGKKKRTENALLGWKLTQNSLHLFENVVSYIYKGRKHWKIK